MESTDVLAQQIGTSLTLQEAVKTSCVPLVKMILHTYQCKEDHPELNNLKKKLSQCLYEAVQMATKGGPKCLPMVRYLLDIGADTNLYKATQQNLLTALHVAINTLGCQCQEQLVTWLIKAGSDVESQNNDGFSILHYAIKCSAEIIERLLQAGSNPALATYKLKSETPLHMACRRTDGSEKIVRLLINYIHDQCGSDPKYVNCARTDGWTPLHVLAGERSPRTSDNLVDISKFLLDNGADVNAKTNSGETPLLLSIKPVSHFHNFLRYLNASSVIFKVNQKLFGFWKDVMCSIQTFYEIEPF